MPSSAPTRSTRIVAVCEGIDEADGRIRAPYLYHDLTPRVLATPRHFAYIKIAEGCDHPCTFCVIPQYRGKFRSRRFESVVSEATRLFAQGVREINLIGQDTTCYGEDLGLKDGLAAAARAPRADRNAATEMGPFPLRVPEQGHAEAARHDRRACGSLVKYIDMPLQHASAPVLKRMKRGASGDIFLKLIERIRRTIPGVAIRTSFIVGFPGETDADFETLCQFVEAAQFDRLGVFSYSDEDTSGSYRARRQSGCAHDLQSQAPSDGDPAQDFARQKPGHDRPRIAGAGGRPSPDTDLLWEARMSTQAPEIDGDVLINDFEGAEPAPGQMRLLRITEAHDYDLIGTLLASTEADSQPRTRRPDLIQISPVIPNQIPAR